jgi:hypothetical protein
MASINRIFLLDRSGSMDSIVGDTIGGYNSFVKSQIAEGGTMSLYLFDHEVTEIYRNVPIDKVEPLTNKTYVPRGSTSLLDAIGYIIKKETTKSVMIILTDGEENSSCNFTHAHIKDLTDMRTKDGWDFVYLGANQDAFAVGNSLGIRTTCTFDVANTLEMFGAVSAAVSQASQTNTQVTF